MYELHFSLRDINFRCKEYSYFIVGKGIGVYDAVELTRFEYAYRRWGRI